MMLGAPTPKEENVSRVYGIWFTCAHGPTGPVVKLLSGYASSVQVLSFLLFVHTKDEKEI